MEKITKDRQLLRLMYMCEAVRHILDMTNALRDSSILEDWEGRREELAYFNKLDQELKVKSDQYLDLLENP